MQANIINFCEDLKKELIKNIVEQGHNLTNTLIKSLNYTIEENKEFIEINYFGEHYAKYLEKGVPASKIPFAKGSGAKKSKYISALINYAMLRFKVDNKEAKKIAFAIANKHKREGMPTKNSYIFSKTNERLKFVTIALENIDLNKYLSEKLDYELEKHFAK